MVDWTQFIDFCVRYEPLFILWDQVILALFGCFVPIILGQIEK